MRTFFGELILWIFFYIPVIGALCFGIYLFVSALIGGLTACPPRVGC